MSKLGRWLDKPRVEFEDDVRTIKLLEPLRFINPGELCWVAPTSSVADGASIPKAFWSFIGGPLDDKYRNASIIHDFYCSTRTRPWKKVHTAFYDGMMASRVPLAKAKLMYAAVRYFGPHWTEMDSENVRVLRAQGITDAKKVQRMPVILHQRDYERWLDREETERPPLDLLRPFESEEMEMYAANPKVNNVRNNGPELMRTAARATENGDLPL